MAPGRPLRLEEVATRLGISYFATRLLILDQKAIPYFTVGARGIRIDEDELEKYLEKLKAKALAEQKKEE